MGSKSAAKSNRGKIVSTSGTSKTSGKSGKEKQTQGDESDEVKDLSVLRKSVGTSISGLQDVLEVYQTGTQEVRSILARECKIIYECRVCENLFRSIANLISHKRIYCQEVAKPSHPSSLPNGIVPRSSQPASTSEDSTVDIVIVEPEPPVKRQRSKSPEHWLCNESTPDPDAVAPDDLPKLEYSVPPIRRRKDICSVIEKLKKRASRQNLANATAVAAHYAALTKTPFSLANPLTLPTSKALYMENISETKNAVYQTMLCKASSSLKISHSENSEMIALREFGRSTSKELDNLTMSGSLFSLPSDAFPSFKEPLPRLKSPVPHDLLIKKRVSHLKEITSQNEKAVLGPDGIIIPNNSNGPMYPPEVFSGNVSNSEGEEQDEEDEAEEVNVMSKVKPKSSASKDSSSEDKEEIVCSICKAKFSTRKTLTHHMKSLHVMFRTYYRCPCCKKIFANNWSVYRHLYKVHRKSTDQVRKLRALIKKKAFRKKILLPLPTSSETPASTESNADNSKEETSPSDVSVGVSKVSNSSTGKQHSSSLPSASRMPSGPGRSSSPLPPPSEATQYPAISAQHAQVLRKLENIVKEDRRSTECYPEFPGVGQSCPGCGRRFERRAALASHVHSCYKQVLLAAQKAKRAINKQPQPKKATRSGVGGKNGAGSEDADKGYQESRESTAKDAVFGNGKRAETIKEEGNTSGPLEDEDAEMCLDERQQDAALSRVSRMQSLNQVSIKSASEFSSCIASSSRSSSDLQLDKIKEEDWDDIERPNSALSTCTHQDSCSPLTLANQTGKQQRIAIQIRRDYVKGDRGSASSSGASPVPYTVVQSSKLEEDPDEEDLMISPTSYSKNPPEDSPESCKQSLTSMAETCSDLADNDNPQFSLEDKKPFDKRELVLQLEDILSKRSPESDGTFHLEGENILTEHSESSIKEKEDELYTKCEMEEVIGSHGEVKRVFLEGFVVGVADPNSLALDDEENEKLLEEKTFEPKIVKEEFGGSNSKRTAAVKTKVSSSLTAPHSQRGRPVRNRVKVEREDFIYDLSDMRLSPAKKDDTNPVSGNSSSAPLKRPRRNNLQQQLSSNSSQGSSSSLIENSSSVKQSSSASSAGGPSLQIYPGKGNSCSTQSQEKASELGGGSSGAHKLSDCRVVIGGLRSGDMKQLSVRRVYTSRKVLTPSNATPVASEVGVEECNSLKKVGRSKECPLGPSDVDAGLFGEMGKGEAPLPKKQLGKSSVLYQSDSLDSTDS